MTASTMTVAATRNRHAGQGFRPARWGAAPLQDAVILEVDWCRHRHRRSAPDRILDEPRPGRRKNMICLELPA
jgi:hypothetical protein